MFKELKQLFAKKNKDLRKRIYFTILALTIYIIGITIVVPGVKAEVNNMGFLKLLDAMNGGALKRFSIFALGVSPYITASIIVQLLQMDIIPYFSELAKQGHTGQQKINQITRYVGIAFAFFEGYAFSFAYLKGLGTIDHLTNALILTAGTAFLLWLGDQVTQKGIGNGISLIILAGIIASLPHMMITAFTSLVSFTGGNKTLAFGIASFVLFVISYILVIVGVIFVEGAERRINIQYANKSTANLGKQTFMPIKINSAGVVPVIFASSLLAIPATIAQFLNKPKFSDFVNNYLNYEKTVGLVIFIALVFVFAYFYTFLQMKPDDMAKNLQNNGGFIPGVKPGDSTAKYISTVLKRLTIVGATFLVILAALPIFVVKFTGLPSEVQLGGTGLLIVVGVAIETYKQLESSLMSRNYSENINYRRGRR